MHTFYTKYRAALPLIILSMAAACSIQKDNVRNETAAAVNLEEGFRTPPDSVKPWIYWYWISDNISAEGITRDLEAMAKVGIGEAFIGNIGLDNVPYGKVPVLGAGWWRLTKHALHEAARTGVDIGLFNAPGWSQSGGPWVKPGEAMRYLVHADWKVKGPQTFSGQLSMPYADFQDVTVLAFPAPENEGVRVSAGAASVHSSPKYPDVNALFDGDTASSVVFSPEDTTVSIRVDTQSPFTARSLVLYPARHPFSATCTLQSYRDGAWHTVKAFRINRSNPNLNVGPLPFGPVAVAFPAVQSGRFRLVFSNISGHAGFSEITLSAAPVLEDYIEKQLGKMHPTPHPMWEAYQWPAQAEPGEKKLMVDPHAVLDISSGLSPDGTLHWKVPPGDWIIERIGMTPTGVTNAPAAPEATGLEVDKMNTKALAAHFDAFIGRVLDSLPAADRKAFRHVVADSYETGSENWTDGFAADFKKQYGYDPKPWLPVLSGRIVGSAGQSNRFLWDLRRLIATSVAYRYVGGLRKLSEEHGLKVWLENYGHWGFPSEFLMYGGQSHDVAGEFWAEGDLGSIELRAASSAAHIYGKRQVWAESFTAAGKTFLRYPATLKKRGDWAFTEGVNHTLLHVYIEQPYDSLPGLNAWFGTEFNRGNTWFGHSKAWIDYMRRCMFLLQRGRPVEDVCYFIGEDAPKMTGICEPALPPGYSFDYINAEVIEKRLSVKDGKLVLPDGVSYSMMVLPPENSMRPELLKKIRDLVAAGATILGAPPDHSPSLQNYPAADEAVKKTAAALWQQCDGEKVTSVQYGKGRVLRGMDMQTALDQLKVIPDLKLPENTPVLYVHRTMADADIYFLTNQSDSTLSVAPAFRITGRQPELWDAVSGTIRPLPDFTCKDGKTIIPLKFEPAQSWFVVFRKPAGSAVSSGKSNFPAPEVLQTLSGPWTVTFSRKMRGPAGPVVFDKLESWAARAEDSVRFYSGAAVYRKTFTIGRLPEGERLLLNLGAVKVMAQVKLNGREVGGVWSAPWQIDVTDALNAGKNELEITVVNLWVNRLIGDSGLPPVGRKTWAPVNPYKPGSELQPSGLIGPVTIQTVKYGE